MHFIVLLFLASFSSLLFCNPVPPPLLLANKYHQDIQLDDYWVSEKYDGVRAFWNGRQFISRQGHIYSAPLWFTKDFPHETLDGELWLQRGQFEQLSAIVRTAYNNNANWQQLRFLVFDAPHYPGTFNQRLGHLHKMLDKPASSYIQLVKQWKVNSHAKLQQQLEDIADNGGEGLMLHRGSSLYKNERSDDLLKLKPFDDAEAVVVRHLPGKGKFTGMMGAMEVENKDGLHFRIGSGFSNAERRNPPAIGSIITYRFNGTTRKGLPRFARFLRARIEW